jgi:hypothetical protein
MYKYRYRELRQPGLCSGPQQQRHEWHLWPLSVQNTRVHVSVTSTNRALAIDNCGIIKYSPRFLCRPTAFCSTLLEPWDVRALSIRKTADLPLQLWVGTYPRFVAIDFHIDPIISPCQYIFQPFVT